tara:strand:+ start:210 stop:1283 length:1074 start_codon:yes stop_codon:yes gene_type:complete
MRHASGASTSFDIIVGVDTHKDVHVAVAIDHLGRNLGLYELNVSNCGYRALEMWAQTLGRVTAFGVEGTGAYGAGLARYLQDQGYVVVEVSRPDRAARRKRGKSDPIDAEMAARAVLAGTATGLAKAGSESIEVLRTLKLTRSSALKARTQAMNQIKALVVTAPARLRASLDGLSSDRLVRRCGRLRPARPLTATSAMKQALHLLAQRWIRLTAEMTAIEADLERVTSTVAPELVEALGVGPVVAATLLVTASDQPQRLTSEAGFAALCGVSPIPASSGKTNRHRLNRGGDRQANSALHRIVIVRLRYDQRTRAYMERRIGEGLSKLEVIRCLKRYVAREVFALLKSQMRAPAQETA